MVVASKVMALADPPLSAQKAERKMEKSINRSLKRLRLEALPICLFHKEENFCYIESLLKLKDKGLIRHVGVSVMTPKTTTGILATGKAACIQLPTNVFDHRFRKTGIFTRAAEAGTALFVRSIYLQGLILMPEKDILPELAEVVPVRRRLKQIADQAGMAMTELCVRYVLSINGTTSILVGVDTLAQMRQNIRLFSQAPLEHDLVIAIENAVPDFSDTILMPTKWSKRMK
jgi:aryl-alcohol dehydrogenase-like predicted oxidoreductase